MGERNSPEETTLAAATAAIITARWSALPSHASLPKRQPPSPRGGNGHEPGYGNGPNGHTDSNHASNGTFYGDGGVSEWAPTPAAPAGPAFDTGFAPVSPGTSFGEGLGPVSPAPTVASAAPSSPAPYGYGQAGGTAAATPWPAEPAGSQLRPPEPAGSQLRPPEPAGSQLRPPEPAGSQLRPPEPAGSAFFSAARVERVPEVFNPSPGLPARDAGRDPGREDARTQLPPGFERRDFGPFSNEPEPGTGGWVPEQRGPLRAEEPRGLAPDVPGALLGVLPPPVPSAHPMPSTLAPPEPAAWTDSGWVDFPREVEPELAYASAAPGLAPGTATRLAADQTSLPKRTPRIPDFDMQLVPDPAETTTDPATQLNRIAHYLREEPAPTGAARPDGVDLEAVLGAVRQVPAVRDAQLRWNAQAGQTLRIEFADGVDETEVTRSVVRLLRARLGLGSQPSVEEPTLDSPYRGRVSAPPRAGRAGTDVVEGRPLPRPSGMDTPRLVVENVRVTRLGAEATVEVRLRRPGSGMTAVGEGRGPGVEAYLSRLAATAAAHAVDQALQYGRGGKVFVEHVSVVPFGVVEVAVVVLLLSHDGVTEQISGSAIVGDDPHLAVVRATLAALNRRLESLLS